MNKRKPIRRSLFVKMKKNICNYIDIPLQHGSTEMLQLMRRGTTREKTETEATASP